MNLSAAQSETLSRLLDELAESTPINAPKVGFHRQMLERPATRRRSAVLVGAAAAVAVLAGGLAVLAESRRGADEPGRAPSPTLPAWPYGILPDGGPSITDHWHMAYGFNVCGTWSSLSGTLEEIGPDGGISNEAFASTGVHSHDDGVIHVHPFTDAATGPSLTLNTFLHNYGVTLADSILQLPETQGGITLDESVDTCEGRPAQLVVVAWPDPAQVSNKIVITEGLGSTPLSVDGMALTIAFTADPASIGVPPSTVALDAAASEPEPAPVAVTIATSSSSQADESALDGEADVTVEVPSLIGLTPEQAIDRLIALGIEVAITHRNLPPGDVHDGTVVEQVPRPGDRLAEAGQLTITVGRAAGATR